MVKDKAGESLTRSSNLGALDSSLIRRNDSLSTLDKNDIYCFTLSSRSDLNLQLSGILPKANIDLEIFSLKGSKSSVLRKIGNIDFSTLKPRDINRNLNRLTSSKLGGRSNEAIDITLDAGEYYARAYHRSGSSSYNLNFSATPVPIPDPNPPTLDPNPPTLDPNPPTPDPNPPTPDPPTPNPPTPVPVDNAPNTLATARNLQSLSGSSSYTDFVGAVDTDDYYRFDLGVNRDVTLSLSGLSANADIALLDLNGNVIQSTAATGTTPDTLSRRLPAGSFYIRVYPETGADTNYTLNISATLPEPTAGSVRFQQSIATIGSVSGSLSSTDVVNPLRLGSYADDYQLNGITAGQTIQVNLNSQEFDTYLQLINASTGELVDSNSFNDDANGTQNSELTFTAQADVNYLLRASSYDSIAQGSYILTTSPGAQSLSGIDQVSGTLTTTDPDNPGRRGAFYDDYRLTGVTAGQRLRVNLNTADFDAYLQLVDGSTGTVISFNDDVINGIDKSISGVDRNSRLSFVAASDVTYFVRVTSYYAGETGTYTLTTAPNIPTIDTNDTQAGSLSWFDTNNSLRSGSFADDYLLTGVTAGQTIKVNLGGNFDTYLQLVNADTLQLIDSNDDANGTTNSELTFTAGAGGNYILRVGSYSTYQTGDYTLTTTAGAPISNIAANTTVSGSLSTTDPNNPLRTGRFSDNYLLTGASAGQVVRVNLGSEGFDTYLQLVDQATGQLVTPQSFNDDANNTLNSELTFTVQPNINYLIRVTSFGTGSVGSYTLTTTVGTNWVADNIVDPELETIISNRSLDQELSRNDIIDIFRAATSDDGIMDATELTDLRRLISEAPRFNMQDYVEYLSTQVANALATNTTSATLEGLIGRQFLGTVAPTNSFNDTFSGSGGITFDHTSFQGSLFGSSGAADINDIDQGAMGDCAFLSALGATLNARPSDVANMIIDNGDNTYTMRFYPATRNNNGTATPALRAEYVTVDRRLATVNGQLIFASAGLQANDSSNILWAPLVERAYAQWREFREGDNGYNLIGNGDQPQRPLAYITGRSADIRYTSSVAFGDIQSAIAVNRPIVAWSSQDSTFIVGGHAYSVISALDNSGQQVIRVRNPWGVDGRSPVGDPNDGFVDLTFDQFTSALPFINFGAA
jgi:hypothetical protein